MDEREKGLISETRFLQTELSQQTLERCNALSERFGLRLTLEQARELERARLRALEDTGRIELEGGVLPKLIYAFCDSPYLEADTYAETLEALQTLFYAFKAETHDALSDDEVIEGMAAAFHGPAQGSLEYLEGLSAAGLYRFSMRKEEWNAT